MTSIVVVGAGLAGLRAAEVLREKNFPGKITLVGAEPRLPYNRPPLSTQFLAAALAADRIRLRLIMRGKRLGFSLEEIRGMIDLYDEDATETAQLSHFLEKLRDRQSVLRRQKQDINDILEKLVRREQECEDLLHQKTL